MRRPPRSERSSPLIRPAPEVPPEAGVVLRAGLVEAGPRDADERRAALRIWLRRLMTQLRCWWWASAETIRRHWNRLGRLVRAPRRQTWVSGLGSGWQAKPVKEVPWTAAPAHGAHPRRGPSLAGRFGRWSAKWQCCCRKVMLKRPSRLSGLYRTWCCAGNRTSIRAPAGSRRRPWAVHEQECALGQGSQAWTRVPQARPRCPGARYQSPRVPRRAQQARGLSA